jgi:hypothetical protein
VTARSDHHCRMRFRRAENAKRAIRTSQLSVSKRAREKLNELTRIASQADNRSMVPAPLWGEEYGEIKQKLIKHGVMTGWLYADYVPAKLLQEVDGVPLIFAVEIKQASHFADKEIDCNDQDRFFWSSELSFRRALWWATWRR